VRRVAEPGALQQGRCVVDNRVDAGGLLEYREQHVHEQQRPYPGRQQLPGPRLLNAIDGVGVFFLFGFLTLVALAYLW